MIRDYLHVLKNLPGILARINSELQGKASTASVDALRYTVGRKADQTYVTKLAEAASDRLSKTVSLDDHNVVISIINERLSERPTHADIVLVKEELGVRMDKLEATLLPAVKTGESNLYGEIELVDLETMEVTATIPATKAEYEFAEKAATKARKPRAPKGGAK